MNPWCETICVVLVAIFGVIAAGMLASRGRKYFIIGFTVPLVLLAILLTARFSSFVHISPFLSRITTGRPRFAVLALIITMGLTAPLPYLAYKIEKIITCILMALFVGYFSVVPFLYPALIQDDLYAIKTRLDENGVCFQSKDYTCGPAAAVTALHSLGLNAEEGQLAVLSRSSPATGTLPWSLCDALTGLYKDKGLDCRVQTFDSVHQLEPKTIMLAVVQDAFLSDHCVAVLDVTDSSVTVADPASGKSIIPLEMFGKLWRNTGIVLTMNNTDRI